MRGLKQRSRCAPIAFSRINGSGGGPADPTAEHHGGENRKTEKSPHGTILEMNGAGCARWYAGTACIMDRSGTRGDAIGGQIAPLLPHGVDPMGSTRDGNPTPAMEFTMSSLTPPSTSSAPLGRSLAEEFGIVACARRYWIKALDFQGRATRRDFLVAMVMNLLVWTILVAVSSFLAKLYWIITLSPNVSQFCRRCHDSGQSAVPLIGSMAILTLAMMISGCFAFLPGIALIGLMVYILWQLWITPGDSFANQYGPNPRG